MRRRRRDTRKKRLSLPQINIPSIRSVNLVSWLPLIILVSVLLIVFRSNYLLITDHTCHYFNDQPCPQIINSELSKYHQTNILQFNSELLRNKLLSVEPFASDIIISVNFPHQFSVEFSEADLIANVKVATQSANLLVSANNIIVGQSQSNAPFVPEIVDPTAINLRIGDTIKDSPLSSAIDILKLLQKGYIDPDRMIVYSDKLILVELPKDKQALFTTHADISRQVTSLQLILSKATISQEAPIIDVRFDQPVLRPLR